MTVSQLQRVDRWLGIPICFLLTLVRQLGFGSRKSGGQIRNLLFVKLAEQGSTVLAYPAISEAVKMVGRENVYFIVFDDNRFILDAMDAIRHSLATFLEPRGFGDVDTDGFLLLAILDLTNYDHTLISPDDPAALDTIVAIIRRGFLGLDARLS